VKTLAILGAAVAALATVAPAQAAPSHPIAVINGQSDGPTPFISLLDLSISPPGGLKRLAFRIEPKPFSVTRAVSASYSAAYLQSRGYLDPMTGHVILPVFGLYADYANTVVVSTDFRQGPSQQDTITIPTAPWSDPTGGAYLHPIVVQPRSSTELSYDFIMLKGFAAAISPVIVDTDAEVRWVGTAGLASIPAFFDRNGIYVSSGTGVTRIDLDGTSGLVADYSGIGVTNTGHHNYDAGKDGILIEVNTVNSIESVVMEVSRTGAVLRTWRLGDIVSAAMVAGGDDPSAFVRAPDDWLHNNSCTYQAADNALIVSGREDFVIALDYDTGAIKWILGDPTKAWYQYASLRKYALTLLGGTLPPIGQHALSITRDGELLLFDDGRASLNQSPIGEDRNYSAPRKYHVNSRKMTALETWNYLPSPTLYSAYCSSVYDDSRQNYLIDYTLAGDVIGLDAASQEVFHYNYSTVFGCAVSWNASPIHLENVTFP
jgi:hypothetical protein